MIEVRTVSTINNKGINIDYQYAWMSDPEAKTLTYIHCIQRRVNNGKWKLCFSVDSEKQAIDMLEHPELIESKRKYYKIVGLCIVLFFIGMIIYFGFIN